MSKVVEGQLSYLQMVSSLSGISHSIASSDLRSVIQNQVALQAVYPDVLPTSVDVRTTIEADTGKVISGIG